MDKAAITSRLRDLEVEYKAGEQQLRKLDEQKQDLQHTLQRIAGAIQVLKEVLEEMERNAAPGEGQA
ncbi:hypothetical protein [Burkholderia gladioli]|uniref:hypothetical protein n=1 Tax=Burkholderia gladioli TaxID=28095 RepID=UPI000CFF6195|nr:hypothetical protein [Burkholderia gladioli]PRG49688.1 hypothetical protein C6V06_23505 [Burkholderia gladioli]